MPLPCGRAQAGPHVNGEQGYKQSETHPSTKKTCQSTARGPQQYLNYFLRGNRHRRWMPRSRGPWSTNQTATVSRSFPPRRLGDQAREVSDEKDDPKKRQSHARALPGTQRRIVYFCLGKTATVVDARSRGPWTPTNGDGFPAFFSWVGSAQKHGRETKKIQRQRHAKAMLGTHHKLLFCFS